MARTRGRGRCLSALKQLTLNGLIPQTHQLASAFSVSLHEMTEIVKHGKTAGEKIRAGTTIMMMNLRYIKELCAQDGRRKRAEESQSNKRKTERDEFDKLLDL